jgi:predicted MarR family transcription regulator
MTMSLPDMTKAERAAYDMLCQAAENNEPCPLNMDIEFALGFNSTSMGPKMIRKLEEKGLIVVQRFQKYRTVEIVATGKQTALSPSMHVVRPHVPRGARTSGQQTDRKLYRKGLV